MKPVLRSIAVAVSILFAAPLAHAGSTTLTLTRTALTNVTDAAGLWQHQSGNILKAGVKVGQYALHRRVTTGGTTTPLNTAMTTITLFFATTSGTAPQNVTLQGAHDFTAGNFRGGVSAVSNRYSWLNGADAAYSSIASSQLSLSIAWNGSSHLTLP